MGLGQLGCLCPRNVFILRVLQVDAKVSWFGHSSAIDLAFTLTLLKFYFAGHRI